MRIVLYNKPGCHLCEDVKAHLDALQDQFKFTLVERNIEEDADDFARFRYLIPVVDIEGGELLYPPHSWQSLYEALRTYSGQ